jgi:subtilisin family serine protease
MGVASGASIYSAMSPNLCATSVTYWGMNSGINNFILAGSPASIVNLSYGSSAPAGKELLCNWVKTLTDAGIPVVTAAGNDSSASKFYPAACDDSSVAATYRVTKANRFISVVNLYPSTDALFVGAGGSNNGSWIDIAAPGTSVLSLGNADDSIENTRTGTSMSSAAVSGLAALIVANGGAVYGVEASIKATAQAVGNSNIQQVNMACAVVQNTSTAAR